MADRNGSEAYDLSLFEDVTPRATAPAKRPARSSAAAPARRPAPQSRPAPAVKPHIIHNKPISSAQLKREAKANLLHTVKVFGVALVLFGLFGAILFSRINLTVLEQEEAELNTYISEAESEHTRLKMLLNSSVSREKVEDYAVNVLGMQKLERCQIRYFESREDDEVILCNGETPAQQGAAENDS